MTDIVRADDWEDRLKTYLDRVSEDRFAWGEHDCAMFAAGAVRAMTGVDFGADLRGTYSTATSAKERLREIGDGTLLKYMRRNFGEALPVSLAKRGDLVMRDRTTIGVCVGTYTWFVGEEGSRIGLLAEPTSLCAYAFSIPFAAVSNG